MGVGTFQTLDNNGSGRSRKGKQKYAFNLLKELVCSDVNSRILSHGHSTNWELNKQALPMTKKNISSVEKL